MCWVEPCTARVIRVKATEPTTPKMEVMNAYRMPGISVTMESITAWESLMLKPDRPRARPTSVPRKPMDTSRPGSASEKLPRPGP